MNRPFIIKNLLSYLAEKIPLLNTTNFRGDYPGAAGGIAAILSIIGMVFLTPRLWPMVQQPLWRELTALYEFEIARWLMLGAQFAAYPLVYCAIRMALAALFAVLLLQIERRLR